MSHPHVLISAHLDGGEKERIARELHSKLRDNGINSFLHQVVGDGEALREQMAFGLANMSALLCICFEDYGAKTPLTANLVRPRNEDVNSRRILTV